MKVFSFGEVLWDVYPDEKYIGGAPFNFAVHYSRIGGDVYLVSAVGNDSLGQETLNIVNDFGVKTDYINTVKNKDTGKCLVTLDENAVPGFDLLNDQAYDRIRFSDGMKADMIDLLYFGTLALRGENNRNALSEIIENCRIGKIFVDVNLRAPYYNSETVTFAVSKADIIKISDEELPETLRMLSLDITEDILSAASEIAAAYPGLELIVVTRGSLGSFAFRPSDGRSWECDAVRCVPVSTVGAGDSFSAAFMNSYLNGKDIPECLETASELASRVVSMKGAV